jgi:hypothetical protein
MSKLQPGQAVEVDGAGSGAYVGTDGPLLVVDVPVGGRTARLVVEPENVHRPGRRAVARPARDAVAIDGARSRAASRAAERRKRPRLCGDIIVGSTLVGPDSKPIGRPSDALDGRIARLVAIARAHPETSWAAEVLDHPDLLHVARRLEAQLRRVAREAAPLERVPSALPRAVHRKIHLPTGHAPVVPGGLLQADLWSEVLRREDPAAHARVFATEPPVLDAKTREQHIEAFRRFSARDNLEQEELDRIVREPAAKRSAGRGYPSTEQRTVEKLNQDRVLAELCRLRKATLLEQVVLGIHVLDPPVDHATDDDESDDDSR